MKAFWSPWLLALATMVMLSGAGCATNRVDWDGRVGSYTFDDAVREFGPPDKSAQLTDGSTVADWIIARGARMASTYAGGWYPYGPYGWTGPSYVVVDPPGPSRVLRLVFDPQGKLASWKRLYQ
jgi:hypothetical protein